MPITKSNAPAKASLKTTVLLGFGAILFDGYDLLVYGATIPVLLEKEDWDLTPAQAGQIGSYALMGMFIGALLIGALTDRFGRRMTFIGSMALFSLMMIGVAAAPTPEALGLFRFLAGLGFGGIVPTAIAMVIEAAPSGKKNFYNAIMLSGFPIGGVVASLMAVSFLESVGFRFLFIMGALPLVTLVPAAYFLLPKTETLKVRGTAELSRTSPKDLFVGRAAVNALLFSLVNFVGFLLVFGLNTWLPALMREAGYDLGSALKFMLALNVGAVFGGVLGSMLADRRGSKYVAFGYFAVAACALAALGTDVPESWVYMIVILAGAAAVGNQIVVYGFVANHYPDEVRATALGFTSGIGRLGAVAGPLIGGYLIGQGHGLSVNVLVFAAIAVVGSAACVLVGAPAEDLELPRLPASKVGEHAA